MKIVPGDYRRRNAETVPAAPGEILRVNLRMAQELGYRTVFLEPSLCGLV